MCWNCCPSEYVLCLILLSSKNPCFNTQLQNRELENICNRSKFSRLSLNYPTENLPIISMFQ
jgi:hypothetical protein